VHAHRAHPLHASLHRARALLLCWQIVDRPKVGIFRRLAPWAVTAAALGWVFGRTDWARLVAAMEGADLPVFLAVVVADKAVFFLVWALLQAEAIRRFVVPVGRREVLAIRGGSEIFRAVNNPLADAAFLVGVGRLSGGKLEAVVAAGVIPFATHLLVLLAQASLALPFLPGGAAANRDVALTALVGWSLVALGGLLLRAARLRRHPLGARTVGWLEGVRARDLLPFFACFAALGAFDVLIQGLASRAFGIPIPWSALAARIPILYLALSVPSVGNFGVREFTWAALFEEHGSQDALFAYAFATNGVFLLLNVLIGAVFFRRAFELATEVRRTARSQALPEPLLHDAIDP
jgi:hypothetical protein